MNILEKLNSKEIIHRDISPGNMLLGTGENAMKVHLIDFGLAKKIEIDSLSLETAKFFGTPLFASINSHYKDELSYRDDLESL